MAIPLPTPTNNDVPSTDIRDAVYAGAMLDKAMTGTDLTYTDRKGGQHDTWSGIQKKNADKLAQIDSIIASLDTASFTFPDTASGISGTTSGQYFRVPQGTGSDASFIYYRNDNGNAVAVAELPSSASLDKLNENVGGMGEIFRTPNMWFDDTYELLAGAPATGTAYVDKNGGFYNKSANATGEVREQDNRNVFYLAGKNTDLAYVQYNNTLASLELKPGEALFSFRILSLSDSGRQNDRAAVIQLDSAGQEITRDTVRFPVSAITEHFILQVPFTIQANCVRIIFYISVSDSSHNATFDNVMVCRGRYPLYRPPYKRVILDYSSEYIKQTEQNTLGRQGWMLERIFPNIYADENFTAISDMWTGTPLPSRETLSDIPYLKFANAAGYYTRSILRGEVDSSYLSFSATINSKTAGSQQFRVLLIQYKTENGQASADEVNRQTFSLPAGTVISTPTLVQFAGIPVLETAKSFRVYVAGSGDVLMSNFFIGGGVSAAFRHAAIAAGAGGGKTLYLSPVGSDTNSGAYSSPLKSFAKAASLIGSSGRLVYLGGDYGDDAVIRLTGNQNLTIEAEPMKRVRIIRGTQITSGWTLVSGKAKTWGVAYTGTAPYRFIFQENTPEGAIPQAERHPLQKGKANRLPSTRVWPETSLANLETATKPSWFYDATAKMLYVNTPASGSPNNEAYRIPGAAALSGAGTGNTARVTGIEAWYCHFNFEGFDYYELNNSYTLGGAAEGGVQSGSSFGIQRLNEIAAAGNDGGNAHNTLTTGSDARSNSIIISEWAHDCYDDGRSPHERCSETVMNSLYEYNGANGYVAALGAKAVVFSSLARKNGVLQPKTAGNGKSFGFGTVLAPLSGEGTSLTELTCYDCDSEDQNGGIIAFGPNNIVNTYNCRTKGTLLSIAAVNSGGTESTICQLNSRNTMDIGSTMKRQSMNYGVVNILNYELIS